MRILQLATLVTPDGAYGGPVRVAANQCGELRSRGHHVVFAAGTWGFDEAPDAVGSVPAHLFPAGRLTPGHSFASVVSPKLLRWLVANVRTFDVVHVHLARDLVTLPGALTAVLAGVPVVLQTHGMVVPSKSPLARLLDVAMTRPVMRRAARLLYLTDAESDALDAVSGESTHTSRLINGVPARGEQESTARGRDVVFLARLHQRKRPLDFARAAVALHARHPDVQFVILGPDEGEGDALRALISLHPTCNIRWEGALPPESVSERLGRASLYVLPSVDEPFPMTVLEAMAVGTPVIVTDTCGLAEAVRETACGLVTDGTLDSLTDAMDAFLTQPDVARRAGTHGAEASRRQFSMSHVGDVLERIYGTATGAGDG